MRSILSERNIVVILFILVIITFSLAQEDSKKMERIYLGASTTVSYSVSSVADTRAADAVPFMHGTFNQ